MQGKDLVQDIISIQNIRQRWDKFLMTAKSLLAAYSGGEVKRSRDPPILHAFGYQIINEVFIAPDPKVEGGKLVLCLAVTGYPADDHLAFDNSRFRLIRYILMEEVERVASTLGSAPSVRGAVAILQHNGSLSSLYWNGRRWSNFVFHEWGPWLPMIYYQRRSLWPGPLR